MMLSIISISESLLGIEMITAIYSINNKYIINYVHI